MMNFISKYLPRTFLQWVMMVFLALLLISFWSAFKNLKHNLSHPLEITAEQIRSFRNINLVSQPERKIPYIKFGQYPGDAKLLINLPEKVRSGVLELEIDPTVIRLSKYNVHLRVLGAKKRGEKNLARSLNIKSNNWLPLRPSNYVYRIPLYEDTTKHQLILQIKYSGHIKGIPIKSLSIKPATFFDFPIGGLIVSMVVVLSVFLPGFILAVSAPRLNVLPLPISSYLFTLAINLFGLLAVSLFDTALLFWPSGIALLFILLFLFRDKNRGLRDCIHNTIKKNRTSVNVWLCSTVIICAGLSYAYPSGVNNIHQGHVTSEHTFRAFTAHDSIFQYINAKSILENDFEKYYGKIELNQSSYGPQDREILPGIGYASTILAIKMFLGNKLSYQYFPYAVYFLVCHALLLAMLAAWLESYDLKMSYAVTFFVSTTPVFWTLAMIGWFKLTGAALVLAGIFLIKDKPGQLTRWVMAGILFGLAKNYHGGNALILPIITLWLLFVTYKSLPKLPVKKLYQFFLALTVPACLVILPWNIFVKQVWSVGSHRLFAQHFLHNNYVPDSLLKSIVQFFQNEPLLEQLPVRFERTLNMLRPDEFLRLFSSYEIGHQDTLVTWLKLSSSYFIPSILSTLIISLLVLLAVKSCIPKKDRIPLQSDRWVNQFGWVCLINTVFLAFCSYGSVGTKADITWHFPTLTIIGFIVHLAFISCRVHRGCWMIWLCFGLFQSATLLAYG